MLKGGRTWRYDRGGTGHVELPAHGSKRWGACPAAPLRLEDQAIRRRWLCNLIGRLPALLGDFGCAARVVAYAVGKRECVIDMRDEEGPSILPAFLQQGAALAVEADLNLTCLDTYLEPMEVPGGAQFFVHIKLMDGDSGALHPETDTPVHLRLKLNADIYAPRSADEIQDNAFLAGVNGPRLAGEV